jgi:hypothetical protein
LLRPILLLLLRTFSMHQVSLDYQCPLVLLFLLIFSFLHNTRICPSIRPANKFCCMQLESGEKGWIKVTDWNSLQTGILLSMSNNQISLSLSSFIHQMKLTNPRKKQSAYSIVICPDPASDSTDAQRARFFAVSSASAASACPNAPMTVRSRKKKRKKVFSDDVVQCPCQTRRDFFGGVLEKKNSAVVRRRLRK